jgi:hypothetical protein
LDLPNERTPSFLAISLISCIFMVSSFMSFQAAIGGSQRAPAVVQSPKS